MLQSVSKTFVIDIKSKILHIKINSNWPNVIFYNSNEISPLKPKGLHKNSLIYVSPNGKRVLFEETLN